MRTSWPLFMTQTCSTKGAQQALAPLAVRHIPRTRAPEGAGAQREQRGFAPGGVPRRPALAAHDLLHEARGRGAGRVGRQADGADEREPDQVAHLLRQRRAEQQRLALARRQAQHLVHLRRPDTEGF